MKINIVHSQVVKLAIKQCDETEADNQELVASESRLSSSKGQARFKTKVEFEESSFFVIFALHLVTEEDVEIKLQFRSRFETDQALDEKFKESAFPYVNAPAIAYPFLRAFISTLTMNAGYSPIMLPSINFVAMKDKIFEESHR